MKGDFKKYFNEENLDYDLGTAYFMALASAKVYESKKKCGAKARQGWGFHKVTFFDRNDLLAVVMAHPKAILIIYQGTNSIRDWIVDADIRKVNGPWNSEVHNGFWTGFQSLWLNDPRSQYEGIQEHVRQLKQTKKYRNAGIWLGGHSLGAAMATMNAAQMSVMGWPVWGVYTYGSPRCGNEIFEVSYDIKLKSRTHRHVRNNDPVPRVPLRSWGYAHVGQIQYFTEEGDGPYNNPSWWFRVLDRAWGRVMDLGEPGFDGFGDHSIDDSYVPASRKALQAVS